MRPFRMVEPGVEPFATLLPFREVLEHEAAGHPAPLVLRYGKADDRGNLLRLGEIALGSLRQPVPFQRDDSLVALLGRRLIESDRQVALAKQAEERRIGTSL